MNCLTDSILVSSLVFVSILSQPIQGASLIQSQSWANAIKKGSFTDYQFDEKGLLTQKTVLEGLDKNGKVSSRTDYYYDARSKLILEKTTGSNPIASSTQYLYDGSGNTSVIVFKTNEAEENFRDSLFYGPEGKIKEQKTYRGQTLRLLHRFSYQNGSLLADTSFELTGSIFLPKQIILRDYDASNRPILEKSLFSIKGAWYIIRSKVLTYGTNGFLANEKSYEGIGSTSTLLASATFQYNGSSLKVKEEISDGGGNVLNTTEYSWRDGVSSIRNLSAADASRLALKHIQGQYRTVQGSALRLIDLSGRQLFSARDITNGQTIRLTSPAILTKPLSPTSPQSSRSR
jgi:hypothetical protein